MTSIEASNFKRNGSAGTIEATLAVADTDGRALYEDVVNLSKSRSRQQFTKIVRERFPREFRGDDIEARLLSALQQGKEILCESELDEFETDAPRKSQAERLITLIDEKEVDLFHNPMGTTFIRIWRDDHHEIYRIRSKVTKQMIGLLMHESEGKVPNSDALNSAQGILEGRALFNGPEYELNNRVAWHENALYFDMADSKWRAIKITGDGWEITNRPPILFQRFTHQMPQVEPVSGGSAWDLLDYVNIRRQENRLLFLVDVISSFIPDISHPIIHPYGGQGAAKTTGMRLKARLLDPSHEEILKIPTDQNEMARMASQHWHMFFDNLSAIPEWLSDILCRLVSGAGFSKRELFTDDDSIIYKLKRPITITGINVVATKPDLLDRCILLEFERLDPDSRKEERQLYEDFERDKPRILGGIFNTLAEAIRVFPDMELKNLPRLADFARWGSAIANALGVPPDEFMDAYYRSINDQNKEVLESHPVATTLMALMTDKQEYDDTPSQLFNDLAEEAGKMSISTKLKSWPKAPHILTRKLREIKTNLAGAGITVELGEDQRSSTGRRIRITKNPRSFGQQ